MTITGQFSSTIPSLAFLLKRPLRCCYSPLRNTQTTRLNHTDRSSSRGGFHCSSSGVSPCQARVMGGSWTPRPGWHSSADGPARTNVLLPTPLNSVPPGLDHKGTSTARATSLCRSWVYSLLCMELCFLELLFLVGLGLISSYYFSS